MECLYMVYVNRQSEEIRRCVIFAETIFKGQSVEAFLLLVLFVSLCAVFL